MINVGERQSIINIIRSSVQSEFLNQIPYLQLPFDIEILTYDDKKAIGYIVIVMPLTNPEEIQEEKRQAVQEQLVELMHVPFVYKEGYTKFLFIDIHGDIFPFNSQVMRQFFGNMAGIFGFGNITGSNYLPQNLILTKTSSDLEKQALLRRKTYRTISKEIFIENNNKKFSEEKNKLKIPERIKEQIKSRAKRKKIPKSYFLMPEERKFPYKDPDTGEISCALLKAAITRASQYNYPHIKQKAQDLHQKHCKKDAFDLFLETIDNIDNFDEKEKFIFSYADVNHVKYAYFNKINIKLTRDMFLDEENMLYLYKNPITKEIDIKMLLRHMKIAAINDDVRRYAFAYAKYLEIKDDLIDLSQNRKEAIDTLIKLLGLAALGVGGLYLGRHIYRLGKTYGEDWYKHFFSSQEFGKTHEEVVGISKKILGGISKIFKKDDKTKTENT